jgi:hypothetical protein
MQAFFVAFAITLFLSFPNLTFAQNKSFKKNQMPFGQK